MTIGERIKNRRIELGLSQEELAKKVGYKSRSSINKIELSRSLPARKISLMARALETSEGYLMGWNESDIPDSSISYASDDSVSIPVLGRVAAGAPILAEENQIGTVNIEKSKAASSELFGLRIKGNSMSPRIQEGDIVIVRRQDDAESGDVVIALVNGDEAVCKKLQKYKEGISLISFNPSYEPMTYTDDDIRELPVKIIGKVIENRQFY